MEPGSLKTTGVFVSYLAPSACMEFPPWKPRIYRKVQSQISDSVTRRE
jgi:hypothetical protein